MSRNSIARLALVAALGAGLAGCADYLNHYDTLSLAAGDAQKHNMLLHAVDPFDPVGDDVSIDTDGERAADAVIKYRKSQKPGAQPDQNITINVTR